MPQIVCRLVSFGVRAMHIASGRWAVTVYTSIPVDRVHAWDIASQIEEMYTWGQALAKTKNLLCRSTFLPGFPNNNGSIYRIGSTSGGHGNHLGRLS
jgi:hypothetical protein